MKDNSKSMAPYGGQKATGCGGVKCHQGPKAKLVKGKGGKGLKGK